MKRRIRGSILWGVIGNGINWNPLVIMMIFQAHLRYTITVFLIFLILLFIILFRLFFNFVFRDWFKILTSRSNKYTSNYMWSRNSNLLLGHKFHNINVGVIISFFGIMIIIVVVPINKGGWIYSLWVTLLLIWVVVGGIPGKDR